MYKRCWGCNIDNIQFFSWLSGSNLCETCRKNILSDKVSENYKANMLYSEKSDNFKKAKQTKNPSSQNSSDWLYVCIGAVIIFILFVIFSKPSDDNSKECVARYTQEPTKEQLDIIRKEEADGIHGDHYLLSKKVGCK